jgi:hypothetical protein
MTVLYFLVRIFTKRSWLVVLTSKCSRCAILEYHFLCMFAGLDPQWSANKPSLATSMDMLSMLLSMLCFFIILIGILQSVFHQSRWQVRWEFYTDIHYSRWLHSCVGVSAMLDQLVVSASWLRQMWALLEFLILRGWPLIGYFRHYYERHDKLDEWDHECSSGRWVTAILSDIDLAESSYKSSWLHGYMLCIMDRERC